MSLNSRVLKNIYIYIFGNNSLPYKHNFIMVVSFLDICVLVDIIFWKNILNII